MKTIQFINKLNNKVYSFDIILLAFRILVSLQLIVVHGLKKVGIGIEVAETVPNPFNLPNWFNESFAIASNLLFPIFVIVGFYTRLATIPILVVTLSGYFIVHWNDSLLVRDIPFMYSIAFLLIAFSGAGKYSIDEIVRNR
jgi:putative oxidoreductase